MARITVYKNSVLASVVSLCSYGMLALGVMSIMQSEFLMGAIALVIGFALGALGDTISANKRFKTWQADLEAKGLIAEIRQSQDAAIAAYNECAGPKALAYIRTLNPDAADSIERQQAIMKQAEKEQNAKKK